MSTKKLTVFLLLVFLPMMAVSLAIHFGGASAASADPSNLDPLAAMKGFLMSAGAMLIPLLAVVFTQLIFKEPVLKGLGISFKFNRWWWIGWLLMPVIALAYLGVSLLMPGEALASESETVQMAMKQMGRAGLGGFIVLLITDVCLYLCDRHVSKERIFTTVL